MSDMIDPRNEENVNLKPRTALKAFLGIAGYLGAGIAIALYVERSFFIAPPRKS
jgi:hypothetical protein